MSESSQDKLSRVRKPRVHVTYNVETEGGSEKKELPFVMGVVADLSGNAPAEKPKAFKERKFVNVDRDNFDDVLRGMKPGVKMRVENTLKGDGSEMGVDLKFESMDDFEPAAIVEKVEPLRKLLEARRQLTDLLGKVDSNDRLEEALEAILENTDNVSKLAGELGLESAATDGGGTDG